MDNGVISGLHTWLAVSLIFSQYYGDITLLPSTHLLWGQTTLEFNDCQPEYNTMLTLMIL